MEALSLGKRNEDTVENPEESNALLEFPSLNPYESLLQIEDGRDTKEEKKEKSRKRKREKKKKILRKRRRHGSASKSLFRKETDSDESNEEISPWPEEWNRTVHSHGYQYDDSDDSERLTHAFRKGKSGTDKQMKSNQTSGKAERVGNASESSSLEKSHSTTSQQDMAEWCQEDDSSNKNSYCPYESSSDTERRNTLYNDSGRYTYREKTDFVSQRVSASSENENHFRDVGKKHWRPETSDSSNDPMLYRPASMPAQSENFRNSRSIPGLYRINPDKGFYIRDRGNSAVYVHNSSDVEGNEFEYVSDHNKAGCSHDFCGTVVNKMTEDSNAEDEYISYHNKDGTSDDFYGTVVNKITEDHDAEDEYLSYHNKDGTSDDFYGTVVNKITEDNDAEDEYVSYHNKDGTSDDFYGTVVNKMTEDNDAEDEHVSYHNKDGTSDDFYGTVVNKITEDSEVEDEHVSDHNKAGSSHDFCGKVVNKMTEDSNAVDELRNEKEVYGPVTQPRVERYYSLHTRDRSSDTSSEDSHKDDHVQGAPFNYGCTATCSNSSKESQVAGDIQRANSHQPETPPIYDYASSSRISSKEPQTSDHGQGVAPYLSQTPLNPATAADRRPSVEMHSIHQSGDAQGATPKQNTVSPQPSTSAAADQIGLKQDVSSGNRFCDIIIRSVPISFLSSMQAKAQNVPQGDPSGNAAIHIEPGEADMKGSLFITINSSAASHTSHLHGEMTPMRARRDTEICSPSEEEFAHIRRKRRFRYLSLKKPSKVDESSADDEMTDESSDDSIPQKQKRKHKLKK